MSSEEFKVSYADILRYVGPGVRAYEEGERVVKANHIMYCAITSRRESYIKLMALCLQTTDCTKQPHEVDVKLTSGHPLTINCKCSCKAGNSGCCKHTGTVLLYLNRYDLSEIEDGSCTDNRQKWSTLKNDARNMYTEVPISEFCCVEKRKKRSSARQSDSEPPNPNCFLTILIKGVRGSELNNTLEGWRLESYIS